MDRLTRLDIFPKYDRKFEAEARDRTVIGAALSLTSVVVTCYLILCELTYYNSIIVRHQIDVDADDRTPMVVHIDLTTPHMACSRIGLDAVDAIGDPVREGSTVDYLPWGAASNGCQMKAKFYVNKVQGNIHVAPGRADTSMGIHLHEATLDELQSFDVRHHISSMQFGPNYPGQINPLDNFEANHEDVAGGAGPHNGMHTYHVKIVPTEYVYLNGTSLMTSQYSVTHHYQARIGEGQMPGIFFLYEPSPIRVRLVEGMRHRSLVHVLLVLCSIIGGVFTVSSIVDGLVHVGLKRYRLMASF